MATVVALSPLFIPFSGYHLFPKDLKPTFVILGICRLLLFRFGLFLHFISHSPLSYVYDSHLEGEILRPSLP